MKKAHKLKTLLLISIAVVLAAGVFGGAYLLNNKWRTENAKWNVMKEQIVEDSSLVKSVYRIDNGPVCDIIIVMNSSASFDQIEAIYKSVLTQLCDEETLKELVTYHTGHASGELAFLEIDFRDPDDEIYIYRFSASKETGFEEWYVYYSVDSDKNNIKYNMSDYVAINDE